MGAGLGGSKIGNEKDGKQQPQANSKSKQSKQLPFARTRADERKLKVVLIPATAAEMALERSDGATSYAACRDPGVNGKGKEKEKSARNGNGKSKANTDPNKCKCRELEEIVRSETVVYPSWDRYIVRRAD